jgi:hypothetical protein
MKTAAFFLALLALSCQLRAATAYQALEYLTDRKGSEALADVFIVRGEGGKSQPEEWIIFRGRSNGTAFQTTGIRADGKISSGTASAREAGLPPHSRPINFSVLNLDTNAAWNIAKRQARKENFRFNRADYELSTHPIAGAPAWTLRLFNDDRSTMGVLVLSGATGEVLNSLKLYRYQIVDEDGYQNLITRREPWGYRALRSVGRWFSQTGEAYGHDLMRAAGTAEEILVDKRTRSLTDDSR